MIRVQKRQQQARAQNRKQEVLRLITCEKQRIPLNSRSQSSGASNRTPSKQAMQQARQGRAEIVSELNTVSLTTQLEDSTGTTLSARGSFAGP